MLEAVIVWVILCFSSFGVLGLTFLSMKKRAMKPWQLRFDKSHIPKISIIIPTYNESNIIDFKLRNMANVDYPKDLTQIVVVDSSSTDNTLEIVNNFAKNHPENTIKVLTEETRKGKTAALNLALKHCEEDIVIVSDADCFLPPNILRQALPFLADPQVGAISGPKILLNPQQSWTTRTEENYLDLMNLMKLGESKVFSTVFFEGGFSAYKRELLESFDPYNTGSDDCGTIIELARKKSRAIFVSEAKFYSAFPTTWREKTSIKTRRANQVVRVLSMYVRLMFEKSIKAPKKVIVQSIFNYLFAPIIFVALLIATIYLLFVFPYFVVIFSIFLIPKVRSYLIEIIINYLVLFLSILSVAFNKRFVIWSQPKDRALVKEEMLRQYGLI